VRPNRHYSATGPCPGPRDERVCGVPSSCVSGTMRTLSLGYSALGQVHWPRSVLPIGSSLEAPLWKLLSGVPPAGLCGSRWSFPARATQARPLFVRMMRETPNTGQLRPIFPKTDRKLREMECIYWEREPASTRRNIDATRGFRWVQVQFTDRPT
jgi:hypothetical protein